MLRSDLTSQALSSSLPVRRHYTMASQVGGLCVAAIGVAAIFAWAAGSGVLQATTTSAMPAPLTTGLMLAFLGVSLCLGVAPSPRARGAARVSIVAALVFVVARLVEETTLFTPLMFVLTAPALFVQTVRGRSRYVGELTRALAFAATLVALVVVLGYAFEAPLLQRAAVGPMTLVSAVAFVVLGLSLTVPATLRDLAERREQERARAQIDGAFEHAAVGIALVAPDGRWLRVNRALCELVGYEERELLATTFQTITHPDDLETDLGFVRQMLAGEIRTYQMEKRYIHRTGNIIWVLLSVSLVRDAAGEPLYFISQIKDVSERKHAEAALTRQALVFATISDAVIVMDLNGRITDWNPAAERIYGYRKDEILGRDVECLHHPRLEGALEREIRATLGRDGRWSGEVPFMRKDGAEGLAEVVVIAHHDASGMHDAWIGVNRDVTERRRTEEALRVSEEQLRQSQRLEAVGQLAGGVAHDFNNILTVIKAHAEFALEDLGPAHPQASDVQTIREAAERASSLTRHLLAFSRRQVLQPRVLDLNALVTQFEKMVRRVIPVDIDIALRLATDLAPTEADPGQLEQVLMNLVVNARDAMPTGGTIAIETTNAQLDSASAARHAPTGVVPGVYVSLVVSDTGIGMDDATQARIFEPFFTTKGKGKGTGLGLSTVYGIIKQSGGYVWVYSEPGQGTTFRVYLPRATAPVDAPEPVESTSTLHGTETVLLVEDDPLVRSVARRLLDKNGYRVLEADNGTEALRIGADASVAVDLILSDLVMPGLGGREVAVQLRARFPRARVLFMSGYTEEAALRRRLLEPGEAFVAKPFTPDVLLRKVREVLDQPPERSAGAARPDGGETSARARRTPTRARSRTVT